jgi:hypothetical protein
MNRHAGPFVAAATAALTLASAALAYADAQTQPPLPSPNGFDYFVKAGSLTVEAAPMQSATNLPPNLKDPNTLRAAQELVVQNQAAIDTLHQGFRYDYQTPPLIPDAPYPYLRTLRATARVLNFEATVDASEGNPDGVVQATLDAVQMGAQIPKGGLLIHMLVGTACEAMGRRPLWENLDSLDPAQCKAAIERMQRVESEEVPFGDIVASERDMGDRHLKSAAGSPTWKTDLIKDMQDPTERAEIMSAPANVGALQPAYDSYMNALIAASRVPYGAPRPAVPALDPGLAWLIPDYGQSRYRYVLNETQNALLITALAVTAYHQNHGRYPESLEALAPAYLPSVPIDPFSAGFPLRYRLSGGSPVLYSVGPDGKDDGGTPIAPAGQTPQQQSTGDIVAGVNGY